MQLPPLLTYLAWGQGLYFAATGVWALVSIRTFEMVTGPKTDKWLVKTVGVLVLVIGAVLMAAAYRGGITTEVAALAVGAALGIAGIEVWYVARRVIAPIYLCDAVVEVGLATAWLVPTLAGASGHGPA